LLKLRVVSLSVHAELTRVQILHGLTQTVKAWNPKLGHNSEESEPSDSANRLGVRQLAAALDDTSLLVLDSAILVRELGTSTVLGTGQRGSELVERE
jgi:hypothetical protein